MTKLNDKVIEFLEVWFKNKEYITKEDYKMLRKFAYGVLK